MVKLSLKDFEFHISSTTWSIAQDLVTEGHVHSLQEVERHFWVAKVTDGESTWESEVIITPSKIKAYACECWSEQRKLMCPHIAATLLQVRKFLNQRAEQKEKEKLATPQMEAVRISVQKVLAEVPVEALQEFVKAYARRDRDFALALKTRFADLVDPGNNTWRALLDSLLPRNGGELKEPDYRRLRSSLADVEDRLRVAEETGDQLVRYRINAAILLALSPVAAAATTARKAALTGICTEAFNRLMALLKEPSLSPELRAHIRSELTDAVFSSTFPMEMHRPVLQYLAPVISSEKAFFDTFSKRFFEQNWPPEPLLLHLYLVCLAQKKQPAGVVKVLKDIVYGAGQNMQELPPLVRNAVLELYYTQSYEAAAAAVQFAIEQFRLSPARKSEMERLQYNIAEAMGDQSGQLRFLQSAYLLHGSSETLDTIQHLSGPDWPTVMQAIIAEAQSQNAPDRIAQILAREGEETVLAAWLEQQSDIALILRYAASVSDPVLKKILLPLFTKHLEDHFGRPAAEFVRDALGLLLPQQRSILVRQLIKALVQAFPQRSGLEDTLEELFDMGKRLKIGNFS